MNLRRALGFAAVVAAVFALVLWVWRKPDVAATTDVKAASPAPAMRATPNISATTSASATPAPQTNAPLEASAAGSASGSIHFERSDAATSSDTRGDTRGDTQIDVHVQAAVGIWQPNSRRLRIVLLEHAPTAAQAAQLVTAVAAETLPGPVTPPYAVIDLRFVPTAQAFDRNELDGASLTATNTLRQTSTADLLGSLDWNGSLPSPRADGVPSTSQLQLSAAGSGQSMDRESWQQSWQFTVAVPVSRVE